VKALRFRDVALFQHATVDAAHLSKQQRRDVRFEVDLCAAARFLRTPAQVADGRHVLQPDGQ
jgi:hypothetical protein